MRNIVSNYAPIFIVLVLLASIVGGYFYFQQVVIPTEVNEAVNKVEESYMASRTTVLALKPEATIPKYTELTKEIIEANFELRTMDVNNLIPGSIQSSDYETAITMIEGKLAAYDLLSNQVIGESLLIEKEQWYEGYERIEDYRFNTIVGDTVKAGDYIDVKVNFEDGTSAIVYSKAKVIAVNFIADSNGNVSMSIPNPYIVLLNVEDPITSRNLELAEKVGTFEASLYYNEAQLPSDETFDYKATLEHYKINQFTTESQESTSEENTSVSTDTEDNDTDEETITVDINE